jgi:electron transfer flavoprotein beta subunit
MMMWKMIVCIKAVPEYVDKVAVLQGQNKVKYETTGLFMNESDEYALDQAVALKRQYGGEISLITMGTLASQNALYQGLAKGADKAIRIDADIVDPNSISEVLAVALRGMEYDLILTGVESRDNMASQVGISVAVKLGIPFAYAVTQVSDGDGQKFVRIVKELGGGIGQVMEISIPALLCIQSGAVPRTYTSSHKIFKARSKPIESISLDDLGLCIEEGMKLVDIFLPKEKHKVEFIQGQPTEVAAKLIQKIRKGL